MPRASGALPVAPLTRVEAVAVRVRVRVRVRVKVRVGVIG